MNNRTVTRIGIAVVIVTTAFLIPWRIFPQQAEGLYSAGVPDGAAFVRFVNAGASGSIQNLWVGATGFGELPALTVSRYRPVLPGIHQVTHAGQGAELIPREGEFYTIVLTGTGPVILEDIAQARPDRSQIVLYNLSDRESLDLRTADGNTVVISGVAPGESAVNEVNPIEIEFALFYQDEVIESLGSPGLERGQSYSYFVIAVANEIRILVERAEIAPE